MNPWSYWHGCRLVSNKAIMMMPGCILCGVLSWDGNHGTHTVFNNCCFERDERTFLFVSLQFRTVASVSTSFIQQRAIIMDHIPTAQKEWTPSPSKPPDALPLNDYTVRKTRKKKKGGSNGGAWCEWRCTEIGFGSDQLVSVFLR